MYPSDGTVIAKSPEDSCGGMSSVWKSASLEGKWEALDWQTERNWRPFMWSVVKYSTWARVFHWISVRVRSVCAHFPIYAFIMESRSFVKIWKFLDEKKNPFAGSNEASCCSVPVPNPESNWHWTCTNSPSLIQQATTVNHKDMRKF